MIGLEHFLARGELRFKRCPTCSLALGYGEMRCPCGSAVAPEWAPASGRAHLRSFAVYQREYAREFPMPHRVLEVELAEGPRLVVAGHAAAAALRIGDPLVARFGEDGMLTFEFGR